MPPYSCFHIKKHHTICSSIYTTKPLEKHMNKIFPIHFIPDDHLNRPPVRESQITHVLNLICSIFLNLLFIVGLIIFILWLSLRPHCPRYLVHEFSMPSISQYATRQAPYNATARNSATFNVTARNGNRNIGIYFDTMHLTLYYQEEKIGEMQLLFPFYQSPKNTIVLYGTFSLVDNTASWMPVLVDMTLYGRVWFRLEVVTSMRFYKVAIWNIKKHKMHADCLIGIGQDGLLIPRYKEKKCLVYFT